MLRDDLETFPSFLISLSYFFNNLHSLLCVAISNICVFHVCLLLVPPSLNVSTWSITVNETDNVTLECNATGVPYPIVKWTKAGGGAVLSVGNYFTIYEISRVPGNTVSYQCTASNGVGIPVSATINITVQCKYFDTITFLTIHKERMHE